MLQLVPTVRTSFSDLQLCSALIKAWYDEYKSLPSKESIGVLVSQKKIETGSNYCWGWNIGNSKVGNDEPGKIIKYQMLRGTWEIINGKKVIFEPPHRATWFMAFDTLAEGIRHHFDLLKNKRYKIAWAAVEKGDVPLFAHLLRQQGYYTAPEKDYINGMMAHYSLYKNSGNYEKALATFIPTAVESPPLQPWVELDLTPPPMGELIVMKDAEDAKNIPQEDIESKGNAIARAIKNFTGTIALWLKPKS